MAKAVSVQCPNCGASLDLEGAATSVTCQYCQTSCLIQRGGPRTPAPAPPRFVAGAPPPPPPPVQPVIHVPTVRNLGLILALSFGLPIVLALVIVVVVFASIGAGSSSTSSSSWTTSDDDDDDDGPGGGKPFLFVTKALLADVNGDGTMDVIGGNQLKTGAGKTWVAAYDGKKGERLWKTEEMDKTIFAEGQFGIAGKLVITVDNFGAVQALSIESGKRKWKAELPERPTELCAGQDFVGIVTKLNEFFAFDFDGKKASGATRAACKTTQTNQQKIETQSRIVKAKQFGEVGLPKSAPDVVPGFEARNAIVPFGSSTRFLMADQSDDDVSFIVAHDGKKKLWATALSKKDPEDAQHLPGTPVAAYAYGRVVTAWESVNDDEQYRLSCMDAKTGKHQWDVPVPKRSAQQAQGMAISKRTVFFTTWSGLYAYSLKSGKLRFSVGK